MDDKENTGMQVKLGEDHHGSYHQQQSADFGLAPNLSALTAADIGVADQYQQYSVPQQQAFDPQLAAEHLARAHFQQQQQYLNI